MIRLFFALAIAFAATTASASGKIFAQANGYNNGKDTRPMIGFTVYEKLLKGLAFNGFVGSGIQDLEVSDDVNWFVAKGQLDFELAGKFRNVVVSPGIMHKALIGDDVSDNIGYFRVSYQIW